MNDWLNNVRLLFGKSPCLLCQAPSGAMLCPACREDLPWYLTDSCQCCAVELRGGDGQCCGQCLRRPPYFDNSLAVFHYVDPVEWMIKRLKFHEGLIYGRLLGTLMGEFLPQRENYCRPDVIIPVPLHTNRLKERGYNQSLELAKALGDRLEIPVATRGVVRKMATAQQTGLTAKQRQQNVVDAFEINGDYSGRHVVLLDDVMTTGATMNELAKQFKKVAVARVDVWVCARS